MPTPRAVTRESLGAWVVKASGGSAGTQAAVRTGFTDVATRCLRASYRTDLVEPGQPVLLWVSGDHADHPAGIYAQGWTTGPAVEDDEPGRRSTRVVPVSLSPLDPPVLRPELRSHPDLAAIEVLRMPAGSNPSFLTREQLEAVRAEWPQVTVGPPG